MMMRLNIYIKNVYVQRSLSLAAHGSSHLLHTAPSRMASGWFCRSTDPGTPLRAQWIHKVEPVACCLFLLELGHAGIAEQTAYRKEDGKPQTQWMAAGFTVQWNPPLSSFIPRIGPYDSAIRASTPGDMLLPLSRGAFRLYHPDRICDKYFL